MVPLIETLLQHKAQGAVRMYQQPCFDYSRGLTSITSCRKVSVTTRTNFMGAIHLFMDYPTLWHMSPEHTKSSTSFQQFGHSYSMKIPVFVLFKLRCFATHFRVQIPTSGNLAHPCNYGATGKISREKKHFFFGPNFTLSVNTFTVPSSSCSQMSIAHSTLASLRQLSATEVSIEFRHRFKSPCRQSRCYPFQKQTTQPNYPEIFLSQARSTSCLGYIARPLFQVAFTPCCKINQVPARAPMFVITWGSCAKHTKNDFPCSFRSCSDLLEKR